MKCPVCGWQCVLSKGHKFWDCLRCGYSVLVPWYQKGSG